jgi:hypothetical protein
MEQDIASYLFRNHTCVLPGIGKLTLVTTPAETNFINAQIKAPVQHISFTPDGKTNAVFNELSAVSEHLKMMLSAKKIVLLNGIGTFSIDDNGKIHFTELEINKSLAPAIKVERVVHQDAKHTMLVGDKETDNVVMTEFFSDAPKKKNRWWIAAAIAAVVAIIILVIHCLQPVDGNFYSGNAIILQADSASATYQSVK